MGITRTIGISLSWSLACAAAVHGQSDEPTEAQRRAEAIVRASLEAHAPAEALAELRTLLLRGTGTRSWLGQGSSPTHPVADMPLEVEWLLDFEGGRARRHQVTFQETVPYFCFTTVFAPSGGFNFECVTRIHMPMDETEGERRREAVLQGFPQPVGRLRTALERSATCELGPIVSVRGSPHYQVSYLDDDDRRLTLAIDTTTLLLSEVRGEPVALLRGEESFVEAYTRFRTVGGLTMPARVELTLPRPFDGSMIRDLFDYTTIEVNVAIDPAGFELPAGGHERIADDSVALFRVAEGVHLIQNASSNYNQLAVEFTDHLLVVDAPFSPRVAERVLPLIEAQFPGKPIRYLVTTHFHYDHIGGLASYTDRGAAVLTTPGNVDLVRTFATTRGDTATAGATRLTVETVDGRRVLEDESQRIELYSFPAPPHADEMVMVYAPRQRVLYVADLFSADWGQVRPAIPETYALAREVARLGLEFEVVVPGHGPPATRAQYEWALEHGDRR